MGSQLSAPLPPVHHGQYTVPRGLHLNQTQNFDLQNFEFQNFEYMFFKILGTQLRPHYMQSNANPSDG